MPCGDSEELNLLVYIMACRHEICFLHESDAPKRAVTACTCAYEANCYMLHCHSTDTPKVSVFGMTGHPKGEEAHVQRNAEFSTQRAQLNVDSGAHGTEEDFGVSALLSSKPVRCGLTAAPVGQHMSDKQSQQCCPEVQLIFDNGCSMTVVIYLLLQRKRRSGIQSGGNRALSAS